MGRELTIKQEDFWRLINREKFLWTYFNAQLRYRIRMLLFFVNFLLQKNFFFSSAATGNDYVYIQVQL